MGKPVKTQPAISLFRRKIGVVFVAMLLHTPVFNWASGYWMELKGSGKPNQPAIIQICYGNIDDYSIRHREMGAEQKQHAFFKLVLLDRFGKQTPLKLSQKKDCWEAVFVPQQKNVYRIIGINDSLPVVDRSETGGQNVRPIEYLYGIYEVESKDTAQKTADAFLDIFTRTDSRRVIIKAFQNKKPVPAGTKIRVFNPQNWEKNLVTDGFGQASFAVLLKGLYIIRQDYNDATPGNWMGKPYTAVRHRCNYCLWVK